MIAPRKVRFEAKKKENENLEFRTFLKCHADETELDEQFKRLHDELFSNYDCSRCRNCCKMYHGSIPSEDLERDAEFLISWYYIWMKENLIHYRTCVRNINYHMVW